jgi:hypothetical protein
VGAFRISPANLWPVTCISLDPWNVRRVAQFRQDTAKSRFADYHRQG